MSRIPEHELHELVETSPVGISITREQSQRDSREDFVARLRLLWDKRQLLFRAAAYGLAISTLTAFLIPKRYQSTTQLMPPDDQSSSGLAMAAALASKMDGALGGLAGS